MGNEIMKNKAKYHLNDQEDTRSGKNSLWKIYNGYISCTNGGGFGGNQQKSKVEGGGEGEEGKGKTGERRESEKDKEEDIQEISVWILTRDMLPNYESKIMEQLFHLMKKDLLFMKEFSNHENYLTIMEIIVENRMDIAFVTERVVASLADILTKFRGYPNSEELYMNYLEMYGQLTEPEITRGFYNLVTIIHHLHTITKRYHLNITPENILLLPNGQWKLCGFGLSLSLQENEKVVPLPYFLPTMSTASDVTLEPDDSYLCPEIASIPTASSSIQYATSESDIFSLGIVMYETYHYFLFNCKRGISHRPLLFCPNIHRGNSANRDAVSSASASSKLTKLESIRLNIHSIPISPEIQTLLLSMTDPDPSTRITVASVLNHSLFFISPLSLYFQVDRLSHIIATISYELESKASKSNISVLSLFYALPQAVGHLRPFILHHHLLPLIVKYTLQNSFLWEFTLPILISISSQLSVQVFLQHTSQLFISGFSTANGDLIALLLQNMNFFLDIFSESYFNQYIVMLFYNAINFHSLPSLQSIAISIISDEKILSSIEMTYYKQTLIPLVCHVICQQTDITVKLHGLIFLKFILSTLDEGYVQTYILPTLQYLLSHSIQPNGSIDSVLLVTILTVYKHISDLVSIDVICKDILIAITPLLVVRGLSFDHYQYVVQQIQSYLSHIMDCRKEEYLSPTKIEEKIPIPSNESGSGQNHTSSISSRQPYRDLSHTPPSSPFQSSPSTSPLVDSLHIAPDLSSQSHPESLKVLRDEIQRTQSEIQRLQNQLTINSSPPIPSPQLPLSQPYYQYYSQSSYDPTLLAQLQHPPYWGSNGAISVFHLEHPSPQYISNNGYHQYPQYAGPSYSSQPAYPLPHLQSNIPHPSRQSTSPPVYHPSCPETSPLPAGSNNPFDS